MPVLSRCRVRCLCASGGDRDSLSLFPGASLSHQETAHGCWGSFCWLVDGFSRSSLGVLCNHAASFFRRAAQWSEQGARPSHSACDF